MAFTSMSHNRNLLLSVAIPWWDSMNPADLFDHDPEPVVLKKGDALFHEGEQPDCMYVLLEGTADVLVGDKVVEAPPRERCSARWL